MLETIAIIMSILWVLGLISAHSNSKEEDKPVDVEDPSSRYADHD